MGWGSASRGEGGLHPGGGGLHPGRWGSALRGWDSASRMRGSASSGGLAQCLRPGGGVHPCEIGDMVGYHFPSLSGH